MISVDLQSGPGQLEIKVDAKQCRGRIHALFIHFVQGFVAHLSIFFISKIEIDLGRLIGFIIVRLFAALTHRSGPKLM